MNFSRYDDDTYWRDHFDDAIQGSLYRRWSVRWGALVGLGTIIWVYFLFTQSTNGNAGFLGYSAILTFFVICCSGPFLARFLLIPDWVIPLTRNFYDDYDAEKEEEIRFRIKPYAFITAVGHVFLIAEYLSSSRNPQNIRMIVAGMGLTSAWAVFVTAWAFAKRHYVGDDDRWLRNAGLMQLKQAIDDHRYRRIEVQRVYGVKLNYYDPFRPLLNPQEGRSLQREAIKATRYYYGIYRGGIILGILFHINILATEWVFASFFSDGKIGFMKLFGGFGIAWAGLAAASGCAIGFHKLNNRFAFGR